MARFRISCNVNIDLPGTDRVAPIAGVIKNNATVGNVKVTGSVVGNNDVAGIVNKIDSSGKVNVVSGSTRSLQEQRAI